MDAPEFTRGSALLEGAFRMAQQSHHGPGRRDDTNIDHPVAVAELLAERDFDEHVVAAALLHDVVEDTATSPEEIEASFGPDVARLVDEMTEHEEIEPYEQRKAEHRERVAKDRRAAAIYAADKLASTRKLADEHKAPSELRLSHYLQTLETLCESNPDLPFLGDLRHELRRVEAAGGHQSA